MADRYYPVTLTVPADTLQIPEALDVPLENAMLVDVEVIIPSGHAGLTGLRVMQSSQQIIPWGNNSYLIGDNYTGVFQVNTEIGADSIRVEGINSDTYSHSFLVRFHIRDMFGDSSAEAAALSSTASAIMGLTS